ncbi:MgtC/SapB family protein [Parapusillimonas granuli]|mgnify:CR=1 FL=1|uniref:Protein MgtC n=1 Tax=Parapusillimonas granuli TaxID=380911 RepID=A0A853FX97_9BURK|nr:MgtC/SapB family protein [Parapusillimonas granuli]MBB5216051.1 putative Mg2+ transporter-C (MgtC) family protein [Parapusillimonas granuli]MEB2401323.1 MgtC/SapB family protein [Alcaligenaceae bacterium]NYT50655.1 MgtC/SapB family protein [Parapusillimonas granuli]
MMDITDSIWTTIVQEFSDIPDASEATRMVLRLTMAVLLGAAIGFERELRGKAAGLRTHMLVSLGAAIFVFVPLQSGMPLADASRVLQGVIAGIGFLGAGAIIKLGEDEQVKGLTTAASIWVAAAIGIAAGMGKETTAVISTLAALFILAIVHRLENRVIHDRPEPGPEDSRAAKRKAGPDTPTK